MKNYAAEEMIVTTLFVAGPPHVRSVPDVTAVAGKRMRFKCPAGGYPIETVTFIKGIAPVSFANSSSSLMSVLKIVH